MNQRLRQFAISTLCLGFLALPALVPAQTRILDPERSVLTVRVFKSGLFAAFAHNHEIRAPISQGSLLESGNPWVELLVDSRLLKVVDPDLEADKRAEVQQTMLSPKVLDSERFPEIRFRSASVESTSPDGWLVRGNLTLHGQTRPVVVNVSLKDGRYRGWASLRQTDFGITPVSIGGGTVRVKNEIKVEFEVATR